MSVDQEGDREVCYWSGKKQSSAVADSYFTLQNSRVLASTFETRRSPLQKKIVVGVIDISVAAVLMSISVKYKNENAKLAQAALDGKLGEVERLLTGGMDVNARASQNLTALMAASNKGHTE